MGSDPDEVHRRVAGGERSELELRDGSPIYPVAGAGRISANAKIMRSHLLTSEFKVCQRILKGEHKFHVSDGALVITANGRWEPAEDIEGAERPKCGQQAYSITLSDEGKIYNSEYGTCDFPMGSPVSKQWTDLPDKDYYLKIWVGDHNPACCLEGEIEVAQQAGLSGDSCTRLPPGPLEILHDALTLAGMIPALGAVPDLANAGIYLVEGDWKNAGLSVAMAVPALGEGAAAIKLGDKTAIRVSGHAIEKAGAKEIGTGLKEAKTIEAAKAVKEAEAAKAAIAGAEEIKLSQAEYDKALKMVFPS